MSSSPFKLRALAVAGCGAVMLAAAACSGGSGASNALAR
jgi:hypothetical protein